MNEARVVTDLPPFIKAESGSSPLRELKAFTALHEQDGSCFFRLSSQSGEVVGPLAPNYGESLASCLDKSLSYSSTNQASYYTIGSEPVRLVFLSRSIPSAPSACPNPMKSGQKIVVSWYLFRNIPPSYFDLTVGDENTMLGIKTPTFGDLEMILEAINAPSRYSLVIQGAPETGVPVLSVVRKS